MPRTTHFRYQNGLGRWGFMATPGPEWLSLFLVPHLLCVKGVFFLCYFSAYVFVRFFLHQTLLIRLCFKNQIIWRLHYEDSSHLQKLIISQKNYHFLKMFISSKLLRHWSCRLKLASNFPWLTKVCRFLEHIMDPIC